MSNRDLAPRRFDDKQAQRDEGLGVAAGGPPCAAAGGTEMNVNLSQSMHS
jgi:hypothetical protein